MNQALLISMLREYAQGGRARQVGQGTFAMFLATYISRLNVPHQESSRWNIGPHIPQILMGAIHAFCTSNEEWIVSLRMRYEEEAGHQFSDPTKVDSGNNLDELLDIEMIKNLMVDVTGAEHLYGRIDALLNAERHLVHAAFYRFLDQVYVRGGLNQIIKECPQSGMSGTFGKTTLRSFVTAGRLMFTFARGNKEDEQTVSFVCLDDDPLALGGGMQSCYAPRLRSR